jgi:hypothetical protein
MSSVIPPSVNYSQRVVDVLKAVAVTHSTITAGDLAWAVNYQRVTRSINDVLLQLKPVFEDHGWPPLTSLVVLKSTNRPSPVAGFEMDWRIAQRQCWTWAREQSDNRQRLRGRATWSDAIAGGEL